MAKKLNLQCMNQMLDTLTFKDKQEFIKDICKDIYEVNIYDTIFHLYGTPGTIFDYISKCEVFRDAFITPRTKDIDITRIVYKDGNTILECVLCNAEVCEHSNVKELSDQEWFALLKVYNEEGLYITIKRLDLIFA